jgi:hypothetical protein
MPRAGVPEIKDKEPEFYVRFHDSYCVLRLSGEVIDKCAYRSYADTIAELLNEEYEQIES